MSFYSQTRCPCIYVSGVTYPTRTNGFQAWSISDFLSVEAQSSSFAPSGFHTLGLPPYLQQPNTDACPNPLGLVGGAGGANAFGRLRADLCSHYHRLQAHPVQTSSSNIRKVGLLIPVRPTTSCKIKSLTTHAQYYIFIRTCTVFLS